MLSSSYIKKLWWECCIIVLLCNQISLLKRRARNGVLSGEHCNSLHWSRFSTCSWNGHRREKISRRPQSLSIHRPIFGPTSIASLICRMFTLALKWQRGGQNDLAYPSQLASASCKIVSTVLTGIAAYGDHFHAHQFGRSEV